MVKYSAEELKNNKYSSFQLMKDISQVLKPYKWRFIFASLVRLSGDVAYLYPVFAFASIITFLTTYKSGDSLRYVWLVLALSLLAYIFRNVSLFVAKYNGYWIAEKLSIDSTLKTMQHMFLLDMAWHERENSGNKIKRIQNAGDGLNKIIRLYFDNLIEITVNLIAINIIIARFDLKVLSILLAFIFTYFIISFFFIRKAGMSSYLVNKQEENINGLLFEAINNIRTVKVMSMARALYDVILIGADELMGRIKIRIIWFLSRNSFLSIWAAIFRVGIIGVIIYGITQGHFALGFLILFNGYFSSLRESIDELSTSTQDFVTAKFSIARIKEILNEPITIDDENNKILLKKDWQKIIVENLSFSYGENEVLDNISFQINRGEKIGIVGLSGAGKSTLFKLLLKEREEFEGDIFFDDISIKQIQKNDYFKQVSVVLQDTEVFNFSLRDNITVTNNKQKENERLLHQALDTAHISEFVHKLPQGLDTIIGEKGFKLSGGERQRLGIARAIFKEPQILLLDEATSHLDMESEEKIKDSLHKFFENVTAVVIAHRLTTIKEMDKILVIEDGKLIESGNFDELYAKKGRFFELWEKQKL
ncbi:MAG TPA: ABC transporter ATP-binding protein [Candidatus Paceibacterota bacterium]|jgi:ABC-type multidrug transport system fused ATPase/permease subunit|nr:ABC transporter ATP-binding protein [Candidatus Paceibacterota bacterium]